MIQQNLVKVGMADLQVIQGTGILKTAGLGSCIGLTLFDPVSKVAGMAHIMLPDSSFAREEPLNVAKYADSAIAELCKQMVRKGASQNRLEAKMAGGAQMFAFSTQNDLMRIGPRNAEACRNMLQAMNIPLVAEDTGGHYGRTIEINGATGVLVIRSVNQGVKEL